jgi:hypothetical protein
MGPPGPVTWFPLPFTTTTATTTNNNNNSIQFSGYSIKSRLAIESICFKASTKAQIQPTSNTKHKNKTLNQQNKTT